MKHVYQGARFLFAIEDEAFDDLYNPELSNYVRGLFHKQLSEDLEDVSL